jgi:class 3 adenylate cyclase
MMGAAPSGVVTFLFTHIEGSTRRWESDADAKRAALLAHNKVLRAAIEVHDGFVFSHTGDGVVRTAREPAGRAGRTSKPATLWGSAIQFDVHVGLD